MTGNNRETKRVTHETRLRTLTVKRVENLSSHLKRVTLTGDELPGFKSLSPDDHIKVFFPYPGELEPVLPILGASGQDAPKGTRPPLMRDYTPRRYSQESNELEIEFFIHGDGHADGPGAQWAKQACAGQKLTIGGPRGSLVVPYTFDWYLMIGDESALPSIARRLEELPSQSRSVVIVEVENKTQEVALNTTGSAEIHWVHRNGASAGDAEALKNEVSRVQFPEGDYFAWISAEKACAMAIKDFLLSTRKAHPDWTKSTGYWIRETADSDGH
jgi:NADPH-dependent ferric siderophore reductase